ncbi:TcpQ domain-containing protein [Escherichia albertii]|uniref:TcpQ domain-containing protein n=1 Tax=Escherichia albertii TaxID=208962 RepID=UPI0007432BDA|nr:TcpQ domain-containing protein [Escherichia albertii]EGM8072052.1 pilus assembly protein [Escherichia albertii]MCU7268822.1 toxin co-regulated pilus biosynthesis Q family protein [Escherichia albertii]MCU7287476.1 toxin co-regulated pilus biosynthesis Q family protein [Escherichia albertii]MCU7292360.1 toxin co-regulated pilus biosynthesis Q family protein [Escherichia albertii]MCU7325084.1 toxin co-regulated pilus biosynthesis Q family protein [Escherichia albertii]
MRAKYSIILFLGIISVGAMASPNVINDKPRNPFSIDRQPGPNTVKNRADISNSVVNFSLTLKENALLSQEVKSWAQEQGYKLLWRSDKDYIIYKTVSFNGQSREDILKSLGDLFSSEQYGLVVKLYSGNNVLVIDSQ